MTQKELNSPAPPPSPKVTLPGTLEVVERNGTHVLEMDHALFNALYARTGRRSGKKRHKCKQVKLLIHQALAHTIRCYDL